MYDVKTFFVKNVQKPFKKLSVASILTLWSVIWNVSSAYYTLGAVIKLHTCSFGQKSLPS